MRSYILVFFLLFSFEFLLAQKKPLDHSVYDSWQSIGERMISNDGKWVVYTVCPQEGDTTLVIQQSNNSYKKEVPRGFNAVITEDNRFVIFKIRPFQKDLRDARLKNKKPDEMPKDSLGIATLGQESVIKIAKVRTFKTPEKATGWVAYWFEKSKDAAANTDGGDLSLKNLLTDEIKTFPLVSEYFFDKKGTKLVMEIGRSAKDSLGKNYVLLYNLVTNKADTISKGGNDFRGFAFDEGGTQLAFVAERNAEAKALQKFYKLWYYRYGMDSAMLLADKNSVGMKLGMTISENGNVNFSKSGNRLFFGTATIQPPKDTTVVESEIAKLDIWHYNDDYLQTQQLVQLNAELRRSYLAVYDLQNKTIKQLASLEIPQVLPTNEGDGDTFVGITDTGKRKEGQWLGNTLKDIYTISVNDGTKKLIKQNLSGQLYPSSTGKYIMWYDRPAKNYFIWDGATVKNITAKIKVPLWNEEFDSPDNPGPYGVMGWHEEDNWVYVYDRYSVWKVDPKNNIAPEIFAKSAEKGRKVTLRYVKLDPDERFINDRQPLLFRAFDNITKQTALNTYQNNNFQEWVFRPYSYGPIISAKNDKATLVYTLESFKESPDLIVLNKTREEIGLSSLNLQQKDYNWGTAELYKWKTAAGKESEGIIYKPENFDPNKKYPVIVYFYEKLSDNLYDYAEPAPTRSAINPAFFVSNGYIVFFPDIHYGTGHPGKDALDYVVSGTRSLIAKYKWIDANRIGLEGHSWGGYQIAYIITKTNMFKAAWAGAPVVNMTSAYGGIRYGTGISRQFQYEKTQSRIGKNLWEALPQYMESSPLFTLNKVTTPVVILHNDNDDAVPYTQGIEMFTALKRLGKKAWLISYNGEPHGVNQRKNRKDLAMRFEQFFGWQLKDELPAKWLSEGVPAVKKGKDLGLGY